MPPRIARLAGLGAMSAAGGLLLIYLLFLYGTRPGSTAGLDGTERFIAWFAVGGVFVALIAVHVVIARQLLRLSRGERPTP